MLTDANDRKLNALDGLTDFLSPRTVYVKEMLPDEVRSVEGLPDALAQLPQAIKLYAVHTADGTRVAILDNRDSAFAAARQQEMDPVSVH